MSLNTAKALATASWLMLIAFIFGKRYIGAVIGPLLSDLMVFFIAILGIILALLCFTQVPRLGRKGILIPAIIGLLLNGLMLAIWNPNFLTARRRAREQRAQHVSMLRVVAEERRAIEM